MGELTVCLDKSLDSGLGIHLGYLKENDHFLFLPPEWFVPPLKSGRRAWEDLPF